MSETPTAPDPRALEQLPLVTRGAVDTIEEDDLVRRISETVTGAEPLRVKLGMDPSSPDLHVGHMVQLRAVRAFQRAGHQAVLIVGDATAMVGDPSGRNKLRPQLTREEVEANLDTYVQQASLVLDMERTEVRRNSEWFDRMGFEEVLRLAGRMTVAQMIERDTFEKRMQAKEPIGIHEFLYPLMQGWDSVEVRSDVEIGGTDQKFNLLVGRDMQKQVGHVPQVCLTFPLLVGLDGRKMSKSYGNAIGLTEPPREVFGKVMSGDDEGMELWFRQLTDLADDEVAALLGGHPREAKARLAAEIVSSLHGEDAARDASEAFDRQFRDKAVPDDVPERGWDEAWGAEIPLANLLRALELVGSTSEARRLVGQGAVRIDEEPVMDPMLAVERGGDALLLRVGKRRYARLVRS
jgi:tyrosyl-tRNA synthetase